MPLPLRTQIRALDAWLFRYGTVLIVAALAPYTVAPLVAVPVVLISGGCQVLSRRSEGWKSAAVLALGLVPCWILVALAVMNVMRLFSPMWAGFGLVPFAVVLVGRRTGCDRLAIVVAWCAIGWWVLTDEVYSHRVLFAVLTGLLAAGGIFTVGVRPLIRLSELTLAVAASTVFVRLATFYVAYEDSSYERIVAQPGVAGVLRFAPSDAIGRELMNPWAMPRVPRVTWIQESCDGSALIAGLYSVGPGSKSNMPTLARISRADRSFATSRMRGTANDRPLLDCPNRALWVGTLGKHAALHRFSESYVEDPIESFPIARPPGRARTSVDVPIAPLWVELAEGGRKLYVGDDQDVETRGGVYEIPFPPDAAPATFVSDEGLYFAVWHDRVVGIHRSGCALDTRRGTVFWTEFSEAIFASAADDGRLIASRTISGGFRFLRYSERWDALLAVDYARGHLYVLDPVSLATRSDVYIGRGGKWVTLSEDGDRGYVATQAGGFELDLATLSAPAPDATDPAVPPPTGGL